MITLSINRSPKMQLFLNKTSPFARLVAAALLEYNLPKPTLLWSDPWAFEPELLAANPFSMVPALRHYEKNIYESLLIIRYLFHLQGRGEPIDSYPRYGYGKTLMETTFRHVSLKNNQPKESIPHPFIAITERMLRNALTELDNHLPSEYQEEHLPLCTLQLLIALDYIAFRLPHLYQEEINPPLNATIAQAQSRASLHRTAPERFTQLTL